MCGRYSLTTPLEGVRQVFDFAEQMNLPPRYNIAPGQEVPAIRRGEDGRLHLVPLHWGLIPGWAKDRGIANRLINARGETLWEKPAFRGAVARHRCLIPADGFYEWRSEAGGKQPYLIAMKDETLFAFAGLWERWHDHASGEAVESCCIVTTEASPDLAEIHHRMPVILAPAGYDDWLDPQASRPLLEPLLRPYRDGAMTYRPVSRRLNKVANDDPDLLQPDAEEAAGEAEAPKTKPSPRQGELF
ncbi:MAG TPA: SOS response-associated peptidase [Kiloniellaceae bacterium]|nr:SOS response-associated peptidase [Kiloniellaceae bacterium]